MITESGPNIRTSLSPELMAVMAMLHAALADLNAWIEITKVEGSLPVTNRSYRIH